MKTHWILLANQKTVKIYQRVNSTDDPQLLQCIENPLAREHIRTLAHKQAGRGVKSMGRMGAVHYTNQKRRNPHDESTAQFARKVAQVLDLERRRGSYHSLTLIAEPHFYGVLKKVLNPKVVELLDRHVLKDFVNAPKARLKNLLLEEVQPL
jgi:protein required for attachment to host cells